MDHCYRDNFKPFPHTRGVILSHIFSTKFQKGSDPNAGNTWTFMVMERNRYYRTCKCNCSHCSVQTAQRRIQNWDCMHYFYRNYTDWYYCYDSMRSGSDAHISNRHCRLILSLRYHCLCPTFNQYREMVDIFLHLQIEQMFAFLSGYGIIITKQNRLHCWFECPVISLYL